MQKSSPSEPAEAPSADLDRARAREAAAREILDLISQSRDDAKPVFDAILNRVANLCDASAAALILGQPGDPHQRMAASHGVDAATVARYHRGEVSMDPNASFAAQAIVSGKVVHVNDVLDTPFYRQGLGLYVSVVRDSGIRTEMLVPLLGPSGGIGTFVFFRKEVRAFTPDEIALAETFAAQAVIAIENARQFRELQERLARETATGEILSVISQSPDDDLPVFDIIVENALRLCGARMTALILASPGDALQRLVAHRGISDDTVEMFRSGRMPVRGDVSYAARAIVEGRVIQFEDMGQSDLYAAGSPVVRAMVDQIGIRSVIFVPLMAKGGAIGAITVFRYEVRPFDDRLVGLIQSFAAQAVIAIENVRQFRAIQSANSELETRLAREAATREILEVISHSRDDDRPVFDAILQNATLLCGADSAALLLGTPAGPHLTLAALWSGDALPPEALDRFIADINRVPMPMDPALHISARAICTGGVVHIADLSQTRGYLSGEASFRFMVEDQGVRTTLSVPIFGTHGPIGCISVHRNSVRPYSDDEIGLIQSFAAQAVIAIENVRQFRELQTRLAREAATREILEVISRNPDDDRPVFDVILRDALTLCAGDTSALLMGRKDDPRMTMAAWRDRESGSSVMDDAMIVQMNATDMRMDPKVHVTAQAITEARNIHVLDVRQHPSYLAGEPSYRIMGDALGVRSALVVPLIDAKGALGTVHVHRREVRPFTEDEIALVETFAAQAVIAIENVRQFKALEALNAELGSRVQDQVGEIERMGRLKRFLPSAVADAVVSSGSEKMLSSHRALLGVLFCDIRGFTAFCETAEPEETIEVLQTYHEEMGRLIEAHGAGVDHRMGDGIMVLFNDPLPCNDPAGDAVRLGLAMRDRMAELCKGWKKLGHRLGFGVGVSLGYATVGMVGSGGRTDYTASGTAINLASRLSDEAQDGEILLSPRARLAVEDDFAVEARGEITLKGMREPVEVYRVTGVI